MKVLTTNLLVPFLAAFALSIAAQARTSYVAPDGKDSKPGTRTAPYHTIQQAADLAEPGDVITVHAGIYREPVSPPRGGRSNPKRIVYQAAPGEKAVITGSEEAKGWVEVEGEVWKLGLPNSFFGKFNPYDVIHGDWFNPIGRVHHAGAVYIDGHELDEGTGLDEVMNRSAGEALWYGEAGNTSTTIWAQSKYGDPNGQQVESRPQLRGLSKIQVLMSWI